MPIDFHDPANRSTYAQRAAGPEWLKAMEAELCHATARVVDVGCGGGTYSLAWCVLGATSVVGVDFSQPILDGAAERCGDIPGLSWQLGDAKATGLPNECADIVFQRAIIHHLPDLEGAFAEAKRLLEPGGRLLIQDRTMGDVTQPGSPTHLRGYFFTVFPWLLDIERQRRPDSAHITAALRSVGFTHITERPLIETRRSYLNSEAVQKDLLARTGRSILHDLTDEEVTELADEVVRQLPAGELIHESDHWTVWGASSEMR